MLFTCCLHVVHMLLMCSDEEVGCGGGGSVRDECGGDGSHGLMHVYSKRLISNKTT